VDLDCGDRATCGPQGFCVPLPACGPDGACADGTACTCRGLCEPAAGNPCQRDLQCATTDYCDACTGHCKPRVEPCGRCADSSACERRNDVCAPVGRAGLPHCLRGCTGEVECGRLGPGYECVEVMPGQMACVPRGGECSRPGDCAVDADCPDDHFCNEQRYCQRGCDNDTGCADGLVCENLRCAPRCEGSGDCPAGGECQPDGHCRIPGGCVTSRDCGMPETHCDLQTNRCVPGCERDEDCLDATKACEAGRCRPRGCAANYQCAFGEVCQLETGDCIPAPGRHCEAGCDPMAEDACGGAPVRCLSLQDKDGNALGDFCFEPCQPAPNECPQGYGCEELQDENGNVTDHLCIRRCDQTPVQ
jgi:hypothetical protein